ncbi:lipoyl(octanoyl) transferase LipB [Chloroflexota bacterium]
MADVNIAASRLCQTCDLGIVSYGEALHLQNSLANARITDKIPDTIIFLQHFPTITIGISSKESDIIAPEGLLTSEGISVSHTDRGGGVTYHGPGQVVVYPILNLKAIGKGIHQYMHDLEEVMIRTLATFSIPAHIDPQYPGVWVEQDKIGALGIRVSHWVTKHGIALNVNTNPKHFSYIIPCGIVDRKVTSMSQLLGHAISLRDVTSCLLEQFIGVFDLEVRQESVGELKQYYDG